MSLAKIKILQKIDNEVLRVICEKLRYMSVAINDVQWSSAEEELTVHFQGGMQIEDSLIESLKKQTNNIIAAHERMDTNVLYSNEIQKKYFGNIIEELMSRGWLFDSGYGQYSYTGPLLELMEKLDAKFVEMAAQFKSQKWSFPLLLPTKFLDKAKYLDTFPHQLMFSHHLVEDSHMIADYVASVKNENANHKALDKNPHVLANTVCFHFYNCQSNYKVSPAGIDIITAVGSCCRYEAKQEVGLERLQVFKMREIIAVGEAEKVKLFRAAAMESVWTLAEQWGLSGKCQAANDPFFVDSYAMLSVFQSALDLKYELQLNIGENRSVAASSFNYQQEKFGQSFDLRLQDGDLAHTACIGFGIERWALAILTQFGFDPKNWPTELQ